MIIPSCPLTIAEIARQFVVIESMFILTRDVNESVIIDDDVEVFVTRTSPERVDLLVLGLPNERYKTMLLRVNQTATILDTVTVTYIGTCVDEARLGKVRLGFTAPPEQSIRRGQM